MKKILITILFLFAFKFSFAQIATNHLFIIIDNKEGIQKTESRKLKGNDKDGACIEKTNIYKEHQEIDLIYENGKVNKIYKYFYANEPKNWYISFSFNHYANGGTINNFILMLPKERFKEIARERYYVNYLEKLWAKIDIDTIGSFYRKYEYYDKRTSWAEGVYRNNVFIVFTSDLEKDYVPCYEVDVLISTVEEE